ncbi:hypothetical protein [Zooshikella sp. RANM57]|uniref:hypothetical protein n=1 Tax=Zooshikella sp. RANM57 TaxID=3425863 RepID=UPI003D6E75AA
MRTIILAIAAIFIGKVIAIFNYNIGFNITFFLIFIFILVPQTFIMPKVRHFEKTAKKRLKDSGLNAATIHPKIFRIPRRGVRISSVQLLLVAEVKEDTYWIVCGSWWFGCIINKLRIYRQENGNFREIYITHNKQD